MIKLGINGLIFLVLAWLVGFYYFNQHINSYQIDHTTHTDAIVVLTGGRNRIPEAVKLLNKAQADKLFISGVEKNVSLKAISERADVVISTDREITLDKKSTNTIQNAIEASQWIKDNHIKTIRLVTSNYHIPRSLEEFKAKNKGVKIIIHPVYSQNVAKNPFANWGSFTMLASEYNKFLYVYIKYLFIKELS